jgi:hypothetical protein
VDILFNPFVIESTIMLVITLVLFAVKAFAFVDASKVRMC